MRYATAIWNYATEDDRLPELIDEFTGWGYNVVSLSSAHLAGLDSGELDDTAAEIRERALPVTLHGNIEIEPERLVALIEVLGPHLAAVTFDPAMRVDTLGRLYDTGRLGPFLERVLDATDGTQTRVAIEDFPLAAAVEHYRNDLQPLLASPRYGILIDVGHMNLRRHRSDHFGAQSVAEYLRLVPLDVVEVHLHDNDGQRDQHAALGTGCLDFAAVADGLRAIGFAGVCTIEVAPSLHGADPAESKWEARESLDRWRELWEG